MQVQPVKNPGGPILPTFEITGIEDKESWQHCTLRIASLVLGYLPVKIVDTVLMRFPKATVGLDFLDVLHRWEMGSEAIELRSMEETPSWTIFADFSRGSFIFREGRMEENNFYFQKCQNRKSYPQPIPVYQYKYEYLKEYFVQNGFNSTDGALLALKAMFLCSQDIGMRGDCVVGSALDIALQEFKFEFDPCFDELNKKSPFSYRTNLMWWGDFVEVIDNKPFFVLKSANFLSPEGIWGGLNKNLRQSRYFTATARFDLRETIVRGKDYGEKEDKSKNFEKLKWTVEEFTDTETLDFYSEEEQNAILEGISSGISNWINLLESRGKLAPGQVFKSLHFGVIPGRSGHKGLTLRASLTESELVALHSGVFLTERLYPRLVDWVNKHYRDQMEQKDLVDPLLVDETQHASST